MAGLVNLERWQRDNIERKCNDAIREALFYGLDADELRKLLAWCWYEVVKEKATIGRDSILHVE